MPTREIGVVNVNWSVRRGGQETMTATDAQVRIIMRLDIGEKSIVEAAG
jgi:hypothetical protein